MLDLSLAIAHHLLIFSLAAILTSEAILVRPGIAPGELRRVAVADRWYGALATVIIVVGVCRVLFGPKGWPFYAHNPWFWAKMATFAAIGLLSIYPTLALIRWRRLAATNAAPPAAEIATARRLILTQCALFLTLPAFAAAMARGVGL